MTNSIERKTETWVDPYTSDLFFNANHDNFDLLFFDATEDEKFEALVKDDFDGFLRFKSQEVFNKISGRILHYKKNIQKDKKINKLISKKKNQKFRKCQVCNSTSNELLFNKNGFNHVVCRNCNFVFVSNK